MREVWVDPDLCQGAEICVSIAPATFEINDEGIAVAKVPPGDDEATLQQAIDSCPYQAISWKED